jgi:tetratricopeptide (TPR) repeat protein
LVFWAGRYDLASERFAKSREVATALGDRSLEALALAGLARVALNTDVEAAVRLLNEALSLTEGSPDDNEGRSSTLHVLGVALQMSGDLEGARGVISRWLASAEQSGDSFVIWTESANLSMVERQLGNLDRAEDLSIQVVMSAIAQSSELFFAWALNGLAAVTAAKGELTRAGTIIGIASAMLNRANGDWPPDEREQYEETIAVLERGLRPEQLDVARSEGANMTKADALEYVQAKRSTG